MKILVLELLANMILAKYIAGFLNELYLKSSWVNHRNLAHVDIDWRKIKVDLIAWG